MRRFHLLPFVALLCFSFGCQTAPDLSRAASLLRASHVAASEYHATLNADDPIREPMGEAIAKSAPLVEQVAEAAESVDPGNWRSIVGELVAIGDQVVALFEDHKHYAEIRRYWALVKVGLVLADVLPASGKGLDPPAGGGEPV